MALEIGSPEELIICRRKQLLVHRILYYCYDAPMVEDHIYDKWERQLAALEKEYPELAEKCPYHDITPTTHVGSSDRMTYPIELLRVAESLLHYKGGLSWILK